MQSLTSVGVYGECEYNSGNLLNSNEWIRGALMGVHAEVYTRISDGAVVLRYRAFARLCMHRCGGCVTADASVHAMVRRLRLSVLLRFLLKHGTIAVLGAAWLPVLWCGRPPLPGTRTGLRALVWRVVRLRMRACTLWCDACDYRFCSDSY